MQKQVDLAQTVKHGLNVSGKINNNTKCEQVMRRLFLKNVMQAMSIAASMTLASPGAQAGNAEVLMMQAPVGENSSLSRLVTDAKGRVHLSWVTSNDEVSTLYYATFANDEWGDAELIAQGDDWFINWADFPSLVVNDNSMAAHWLRLSSDGTYDYDVNATFYTRKTQSWGEAITIHKDGVSAEHGFVSMLPMSEGRTFISWLDGRKTVKDTIASAGDATSGGMTLRAGIFDRDGKTLHDWELDGLTCDCCQTSAAMSASGPIVVYRDRSDHEVRDIYITRFFADKWSAPVPVFSDDWVVAGCPVNGPAVAAKGSMTAVVWFSAKDDQPKVKLAISQNEGESFNAPVLVANASTNGRVGITILESGNIAVSWLATNGSDAQLKLALYRPQGDLLNTVRVADTKASRRSGFPVITSAGNDVYVTWTDLSGGGQIKVARIRF